MDLTALKTSTAIIYSYASAILLSLEGNKYDHAFQDPYLYISGFIGMSLMLFVERVDDKSSTKPSFKKIIFSIVACFAVMFFSGIARADFLMEWKPFWIYLSTMFLCTIAPEFVQRVIITSPKHLADGINKGLEKRAEKIIGGDDSHYNFNQHSEFDDTNYHEDGP